MAPGMEIERLPQFYCSRCGWRTDRDSCNPSLPLIPGGRLCYLDDVDPLERGLRADAHVEGPAPQVSVTPLSEEQK